MVLLTVCEEGPRISLSSDTRISLSSDTFAPSRFGELERVVLSCIFVGAPVCNFIFPRAVLS